MRFYRHISQTLKGKEIFYKPKLSVIIPCKGIDPNFKENVEALIKQDYTYYEVIFVTATNIDPAYVALTEILNQYKEKKIKLITAGIKPNRSQKLNNQLKALEEADKNTEVFVFVDSDIRPEADFLRYLVAPLKDKKVGATTGFRWYFPVKGGFWSILRSTWNGGGIVFISDKGSNYAWGGAMAIKRELFEELKIAKYWESALSDDMTLTEAVKAEGYTIEFIPQCLVASHEDCTFKEMIDWTNRQTIISKVYHPKLWRRIALAHGVGNFILGLGIFLLAVFLIGLIPDKKILLSSMLMLSIGPMEMLNALVLLPTIKRMLPRYEDKLSKLWLAYFLLAPFASFLALINTAYSLFTNRITWRGITYEMKSANEILVINTKSPSHIT